MLLTEYLSVVAEVIASYSKTGLIISSDLAIDARTEKIGLIKCTVVFVDDSKLFVTEYLDLRYRTEKLAYSFHYQDKNGILIFRYDNAAHKPSINFITHKHFEGKIVASAIPDWDNTIEEAITYCLKTAQ